MAERGRYPMRIVNAVARAIRDQYHIGLSLFRVAPLAVALVVVPEFAQHVAEIHIGMFDSRAAAHALSNDPTRWAFGYVKLTGVLLSLLACARAAWSRLHDGGDWYDLRTLAWLRLLAGAILFVLVGSIAVPFEGLVGPTLRAVLATLGTILSLPVLFVTLAGLFGDRTTRWRPFLLRSWPAAGLLLILMLTGYGVPQLVHMADHWLAFGRPMALVWLLMAWDALVVGGLTALTGTGFALAYTAFRARLVATH